MEPVSNPDDTAKPEKKAVILQSGYIPWLGFLDMVNEATVFVFLDDVQWTKRDWRNRNRVRTPQGWSWLTVPAKLEKTYYEYNICDVQIDNSQNWQESHLGMLRGFYKRSPFFDEIYPIMDNILHKKHRFVVDLNYEIILDICHYLALEDTEFLYAQEMDIPPQIKATDRLLYILLEKIGDVATYISGPVSKAYLEEDKFTEAGIEVEWHYYEHPYYSQNTWRSNVFISYLSVVDLLFNHGKESLDILTLSKAIEKPESIQILTPDEYRRGKV